MLINTPRSARLGGAAFILTFVVLLVLESSTLAKPFVSGQAGFSVRCNHETLRYDVESVFVLPREAVLVQVLDTESTREYTLRTETGCVKQLLAWQWNWQVPARPGVYTAEIVQQPTQRRVTLNVFVMVPWQNQKKSRLNGYRIGRYPPARVNKTVAYCPPCGLVEVRREDQDIRVSPHFQLKQFLCKQSGGFPKYVVLDRRLLTKLEILLEHLNNWGVACRTLQIMSGYRTPYYNRQLGNVPYSSHLWGMAADIYIDENHDNVMDDLNHDGKIDYLDAARLYRAVEAMDRADQHQGLVGGLGLYSATPAHGPFVHVDVRGRRARWGLTLARPGWAGRKRGRGGDEL